MRGISFFEPTGSNVRLFIHIAAGTSPTRTAIITYGLHVGGLSTLSMCGRVGEKTGENKHTCRNVTAQMDPTLLFKEIPVKASRFNKL